MADKISTSHDLSIASDHGIPTDDSRYYDEQFGIVSVDAKRWAAAQEVERKTWFSFFPHFTDDRSEGHRQRFNNYQAIPMQCGDVLEHVQDAGLIMKKLLTAIRPGGYLVLGEFCHDDYHPSRSFKLAHPIMLKRSFFTSAITGVLPVYLDDSGNSYYLIARKPDCTAKNDR